MEVSPPSHIACNTSSAAMGFVVSVHGLHSTAYFPVIVPFLDTLPLNYHPEMPVVVLFRQKWQGDDGCLCITTLCYHTIMLATATIPRSNPFHWRHLAEGSTKACRSLEWGKATTASHLFLGLPHLCLFSTAGSHEGFQFYPRSVRDCFLLEHRGEDRLEHSSPL